MTPGDELGDLLVDFISRVSHPRGRALRFLMSAGITVDQAILLHYAQRQPGSTPSTLAGLMNLSLPSVSQMLDRLHGLGMVQRTTDPHDRRRKTIDVTAGAATFLADFHKVRRDEFLAGTAPLTAATRQALASAITTALDELRRADGERAAPQRKENA